MPRVAHALQCNIRQAFPKARRIAEQGEFKLLLGSRRVGNRWFVVYARKTGKTISRLGVVVSKKIDPKACSRNFAKRLVREEFRRAIPLDRGLDLVVRVKQKLLRVESEEARRGLSQLMREVNDAATVN